MISAAPVTSTRGAVRSVLDALEKTLRRPVVGWAVLGIAVAVYAFAYWTHPLFPGTGSDASSRGWWTWNDQQRYLQEARAISTANLDATTYHYPIGYPVLGSVFMRWMPSHPFLIPDLVLMIAGALIWWKLARRWLSATLTLLLALGFGATHARLFGITMVVPWNTIATQTCIWGGVAVLLECRGRAAVLWLAVLAAFTYVVRPVDAVTFGPLLLFAVWRVPSWRHQISAALLGLGILGCAVVGIGLLNMRVFGQWRTPYEIVSTQTIGFFGYPMSYKFYWLLIDGRAFFGETAPGLFFRYPWLSLVVPGLVYLVRRERGEGVAIAAAAIVNLGLYLNYNDLLPSDLYRFTLIHYLTWSFPLLLVLGFAAVRRILGDRAVQVSFAATAMIVVLAVGIQMRPRSLELRSVDTRTFELPEIRPLLVDFPAVSMSELPNLRLDGRGLTEYSQYLVPYVPSDLKLLLGKRASGSVLTLSDGREFGVKPAASEVRWKWWPVWSRLSGTWRAVEGE